MTDYSVGSTIYLMFTTRSFSTGAPAQLAGTPAVSAYENDSLTQITAGITLGVDHDSVTGLNLLTIVATGANGYEAGKDYNMVITTGTVGGVSVVGEVVGTFSLERSAAIDEIGTAGAGLTNINLPNQTMDITGNITGNLSGSVGSVTGAVGSVTGAVGSVTGNVGGNVVGSVGSVTGNVGGNVAGSVASVTAGVTLDASATSAQLVDDVWDEVITGVAHNVNNSSAKFLREASEGVGLTGTAQAGTATTIQLASGAFPALAGNDYFTGERVLVIEGTGAGQARLITGGTASTDTVTVGHAWDINPDDTSIYSITGAEADIRAVAEQPVTATATVDFDDLATIEAVTSNLNDPTAAAIRAEIDSNSTQLAAIVADTNELQTDWANGGRLDLLIDAIKAVTDNLNDPSVADILTTQMTESYATNGTAPTLAQALFAIHQKLMQSGYSGTTSTTYQLDNATTAFTGTLDDATNPTEDRRA